MAAPRLFLLSHTHMARVTPRALRIVRYLCKNSILTNETFNAASGVQQPPGQATAQGAYAPYYGSSSSGQPASGIPGVVMSGGRQYSAYPPTQDSYPPDRRFACNQCPLRFARQHDLARHMQTHTNERPFECPMCHKTFTRRDAVKRHQATSPTCGA